MGLSLGFSTFAGLPGDLYLHCSLHVVHIITFLIVFFFYMNGLILPFSFFWMKFLRHLFFILSTVFAWNHKAYLLFKWLQKVWSKRFGAKGFFYNVFRATRSKTTPLSAALNQARRIDTYLEQKVHIFLTKNLCVTYKKLKNFLLKSHVAFHQHGKRTSYIVDMDPANLSPALLPDSGKFRKKAQI